ncbi:MAG: polysaccharide deacetylase family protein [Oscillospiraceae bacterium]|nr:polysaccharide deacetylase family protein [Oscillospiraceae bacterium]
MKTRKTLLLYSVVVLLLLPIIISVSCRMATQDVHPDEISHESRAEPLPMFARAEYFVITEFGEMNHILQNEGPLGVYIRYPQWGGRTDLYIQRWAYDTFDAAVADFEIALTEDPDARGTLNIQFDSRLVHDRFASIIKRGYFSHTGLAHPMTITETFNIDTVEDRLLANEDILDFGQMDFILELMAEKLTETQPDAEPFLVYLDASWLSYLSLSPNSLVVMLARGEFLPAYIGSVKIELPYVALSTAFLLWDVYTEPPASPPTEAAPATEPPRDTAPPSPSVITPLPVQPQELDPNLPMVALTFDDGPSGYTGKILDLLEQHGGRATFMVLGNLINARQETLTRTIALGSEVIGHSWDHRNLTKLSAAEIRAEISDTSALIASVSGVSWPMFRPPYGAYNDTVKAIAAELGYAIIYWSVDTLDWKNRDPDWVYNAVMNDVADGAIVLMHDIHGTTADAMARVIPRLIEQGYQLVTVSELLYHRHGVLEPGRVYYSGR